MDNPAQINILFVGAGRFACDPFDALSKLCQSQERFFVAGIITQPDRPAGRGKKITSCSFCAHSRQNPDCNTIPMFQPEILSEAAEQILAEVKPDVIIVVDYGQIIPASMLAYPKYSCLNIHHSLLPQLRGATPVPKAILLGLEQTGTTIQIMDSKLDQGDILAQDTCMLSPTDTALSLGTKLSQTASKLLAKTLPAWISGRLTPVKQDDEKATYCHQSDIDKAQARIDWSDQAEDIDRQIRAFNPNPIAWTTFKNKRIKIFQSQIGDTTSSSSEQKGLIRIDSHKLLVTAADGSLEILQLQPEGKKIMNAHDFINGFQPGPDDFFS